MCKHKPHSRTKALENNPGKQNLRLGEELKSPLVMQADLLKGNDQRHI